MELNLRHIDPAAQYAVEVRRTYEHGPTQQMSGAELVHLRLELTSTPDSALVFYRKLEPQQP